MSDSARAEAERRWPEDPMIPPHVDALIRNAFEAGAEWQASRLDSEALVEKVAKAMLVKTGHKISGNSQGGYDCTCGARWDWNRAERDAAYLHVATYSARAALAAVKDELAE